MKILMPRTFRILSLFMLANTSLLGQVSLVKDINTYPQQFNAINDYSMTFCSCGDNLFFPATTDKGRELWKTDGTVAGTILLKDIFKGFEFGFEGPLYCNGNGAVYFIGRDALHGAELWTSDGTREGTRLVKEVRPGITGRMQTIGLVANTVYFLTDDDDDQLKIWRSDGTADGTTLVAEMDSPDNYTSYTTTTSDTHLFFNLLNNTQNKFELWSCEIVSGVMHKLLENVWIIGFESFGESVRFATADQTNYRNALWSSDGTLAGTAEFRDFGQATIQTLIKFNDKLIFGSGSSTWITDGTDAGTAILTSGYTDASAIIDNTFYGMGFDFTTSTNRLIKFNGSTIETTTLNGNIGDILMFGQIPVLNNRLITQYYNNTVGTELGISNEQHDDIALLKDLYSGPEKSSPRSWATFKNRMYFLANNAEHGAQMWSTDGTENGTFELNVFTGTGNAFIYRSGSLAVKHSRLFFLADDQHDNYFDLFTSDGTESSTSKKLDFENQSPFLLGGTSQMLIYLSNRKLYRTNGPSEPLTQVKDISNDLFGFSLNEFHYVLGNKLLFALYDYGGPTEKGREFWVTDGTESGTYLLKEIYPGLTSGVSGKGAVLGSRFIFDGKDADNGSELWITDGTTAGTSLLKDISNGPTDSNPSNLCTLNDKVVFNATRTDSGSEVWITDGTAQGTQLVKDIVAGPTGSEARAFTSLGSVAVFNAYDEANGWTLWKTDGTTSGTGMIKDILPGNDKLTIPNNFTAIGNKLFFVADDGVHGREPWISDGTTEGTYLIDATPGAEGSDPSMFVALDNGIVYFKANTELWRTNGSAAATVKVSDLEPLEMVAMGNTLYFTAPHPDYGAELFKAEFTKFDQVISIGPITNKTFGDASFKIVASASSGLPVVVTAGEELTIENHTATITAPGTVQIMAQQGGDDFFNASQAIQSICISPVRPTITLTSADTGKPVLTSSATSGNQWFRGDDAVANETNQSFTPTENDIYKVNVTVDGCSSVFSDEATVIVTGIESFDDGITLSPNPVRETLKIETNGLGENLTVTITDVNGRPMRTYDLAGREAVNYSLAGYPAGLYIVRIGTGKGVFYRKIIKE